MRGPLSESCSVSSTALRAQPVILSSYRIEQCLTLWYEVGPWVGALGSCRASSPVPRVPSATLRDFRVQSWKL